MNLVELLILGATRQWLLGVRFDEHIRSKRLYWAACTIVGCA